MAKAEELKGRAKEMVGKLTHSPRIERHGKTERASAVLKEKAEAARDRVEDVVDKARDSVNHRK